MAKYKNLPHPKGRERSTRFLQCQQTGKRLILIQLIGPKAVVNHLITRTCNAHEFGVEGGLVVLFPDPFPNSESQRWHTTTQYRQ